MNSITNLYFEVYSENEKEKKIHMCADLPKDSDLYSISFFFTKEEFKKFASGSWSTFIDITYHCQSIGDMALFFSINVPRETYGTMNVPFYSLQFPVFARRIILRAAEKIWAKNSTDREKIVVDDERSARWVKQYGDGKGEVEVDIVSPETSQLYNEIKDKGGEFNDRMERLQTIAKNGTIAFFQTGKVRLMKDWDGFTFDIISPKGKSTMFGGLVNHGRDGKFDWSIHT